MSDAAPVILVDDDPDMRAATAQTLELAGYRPQVFAAAAPALTAVDADFPGVVVSDIRMPGLSGLQLFERVRSLDPDLPVILVTGHGDVELAVAALKDGAYDFISKPFASDRLVEAVHRALEKRALVLENRRLRAAATGDADDITFLGDAPAMRRLRATIRQIADADVDVLVEGETGSGKEVVAEHLHRWSRRATRPFVALNCGGMPESIIESELFGHEAGAFTGAQKRRIGRIEHSDGGTLFLDEIESMPPGLQVKLLRVLETRRIAPLGTNEDRAVDLRVVAAAKVDLSDPNARGDFRSDLYYRLNVVTLRVPPLRERREDIPLLFGFFLRRAAQRFGRPQPDLTAAARTHLETHDWPGNVRELLHFAERYALGLDDEASPVMQDVATAGEGGLTERVDRFEADLLRAALRESGGDVRTTIERLRLPRKTFYDKLKRHGITRAAFEPGDPG
ncbi:two-component system, NtrC family, C4-dicarboxylate transport response regulator DctD [Kaistia soli DSM 19436]|uniref:Two-component system, NtrC family, C4-dicarboxylate transport response regulator DctD n=1 Tax=Kaistia soli DSM 19436 TaxID=1122133 RepID=A0A1M4YWP7_9HYPH|nr:sigma-54 dependent transcriptional regulator [Kaistia soli]SHF10244.1 two-component system, NtrC family, C4-dicarboxylate transport response regulator DctD [Kaistia soli DSM 19436]